jgi:hypothetical protein
MLPYGDVEDCPTFFTLVIAAPGGQLHGNRRDEWRPRGRTWSLAVLKQTLKENYTTSMVSPVVAYLAHENCAISGETILAQGGLMQRFSLAMNDGYTNPEITPEGVEAHLETILDDSTAKPLGIVGSVDETSLLDLFD